MSSDRTIGRVVLVDSYKAVVEIDSDLKSLTKTAFTGTYDFARINSYVIIPVGSSKIVGMITRVQLTEEAEGPTSKTTIVLPQAKRMMTVTMIGTIEERPGGTQEFYQGVTSFPALDNPVWFIEKQELDVLFDKSPIACECKYRISIGISLPFPEYQVRIDPDAFFGKHAAVIGSTGSGKSCTIAALLQSIFETKDVKNAHFIILDTNGEYGHVFKGIRQPDDFLHIQELKIPYWFMNFEDFRILFRASEGTQAPVLQQAILDAKNESAEIKTYNLEIQIIENRLRHMLEHLKKTGSGQYYNRSNASGTLSEIINFLTEQKDKCSDDDTQNILNDFLREFQELQTKAGLETTQQDNKASDYKKEIKLNELESALETERKIMSNLIPKLRMVSQSKDFILSVDTPSYFERSNLLGKSLQRAMEVEPGKEDRKLAEYCATLKLRIDRFFSDKRYDFLFQEYKKHDNSLASFLRYVLGRFQQAPANKSPDKAKETLPYLKELEETNKRNYQVTIIDLHLLASEILENITALLGRIILDFLQRIKGEDRCKFPVVLILEEAQNYIKEARIQEQESPSKIVFERIAREGRKYGLSLVVASQRLSDLSKTVLSQCNSFIVHRLQNPDDLRYFGSIVPAIHSSLLDQLPSLASQTALILGECVRAPMHVKIRTADPKTDSENPKLWDHWTSDTPFEPDFEKICSAWERGDKQIKESDS
jgi:DNA helicase HerA-like ATPase